MNAIRANTLQKKRNGTGRLLLASIDPRYKGFRALDKTNILKAAKKASLHEGYEEKAWLVKEIAMRTQIAKSGAGLRRP